MGTLGGSASFVANNAAQHWRNIVGCLWQTMMVGWNIFRLDEESSLVIAVATARYLNYLYT